MGKPTVAVAFSGGRDSLALLHATVRAAADLDVEVVALHVHHGLSAQADGWVVSAQALSRRWQRKGWPVRLRWLRLEGQPQRSDSIEAWARRGRYAALANMARDEGASIVLLAHHRRDQAETVLLQALRGAGPRGLAAMPRSAERDGLIWARPWLDQPREAIEAYCRRYRLKGVDDPSNVDPALARSRLRAQAWPAFIAAFPDAEQSLAAVARRAGESVALAAEVAAVDLLPVADARGLHMAAWLGLSPARRANALRAWLRARLPAGSPESLIARLLDELPRSRHARWPAPAGHALVLYRGLLQLAPGESPPTPAELVVDLSRPGVYPIAQWHGAFEVSAVARLGIAAASLAAARLSARRAGEQFQRAPRAALRSLKKQFQEVGLAAHERSGPLVYSGEQLIYVPGLGIDARAWAAEGSAQLGLRWLPDGL